MRGREPGGRLAKVPKASYYQGRASKANSPFVKQQPLADHRHKLNKALNIIILVAVLAVAAFDLVLQGDPKVIASSYFYRQAGTYQSKVAANTGFWQKTKLTYDESKIIKPLESSFPEITDAYVSLPLVGQTPVIHLTVSPPSFILGSSTQRYVLDADGVVVTPSSQLPQSKNLLTIVDQSGLNLKIGSHALSADNISFIQQLTAQAKSANVPIASFILPPRAQELDLKTTDKSYYVKFYLGGDPALQAGQFLAARHQFAKNHQDPSQYLDVRVAGKVFYK